MVAFLIRLMVVFRARFKSRERLEAENLVLRQQLLVLNRRLPVRLRLRNIDQLILVWLYRRCHPKPIVRLSLPKTSSG
jgi:hypothetical protein